MLHKAYCPFLRLLSLTMPLLFLCSMHSIDAMHRKIGGIIKVHKEKQKLLVGTYNEQATLNEIDALSDTMGIIKQLEYQTKLCIFAVERIKFSDIYCDSISIELLNDTEKMQPIKNYPEIIWLGAFISQLKYLHNCVSNNTIPPQKNITKAFYQIHLFLHDLTSIDAMEPFKTTVIKNNLPHSALYSELHNQKQVLTAYCKTLSLLLWPTKRYTKIPDNKAESILSVYSMLSCHQDKDSLEKAISCHTIRAEYNVYDTLIIDQSPFGKKRKPKPITFAPEYDLWSNYQSMLKRTTFKEPIVVIQKETN